MLLRLGAHAFQKCLVVWWRGAGKHEVLPDEETEFVAEIIKVLAFVDAPTPDAEEIHVGEGGGADVALIVAAREAGDEGVGGYPVGTLDENGATVDEKTKTFAPLVRTAVECNGPQSDAAGELESGRGGGGWIGGGDFDVVERLRALAGRPPKLRVGDVEGEWRGRATCRSGEKRAGGSRHDPSVESDASFDGDGNCGGEFRNESERDSAAVVGVVLCDADVDESVVAPGFETDVAPDAGSDEARSPVPAKLALLFAQYGAAAYGIIAFGWTVFEADGTDGFECAGKDEAEFVGAGAEQGFYVEAVAGEHVVSDGHLAVVEVEGGKGVEAVGNELNVLFREERWRDVEASAVFPIAFLNPLQIEFVGAVEGIRYETRGAQIGVHATWHTSGKPRATRAFAKHPAEGGKSERVHGFDVKGVGAGR